MRESRDRAGQTFRKCHSIQPREGIRGADVIRLQLDKGHAANLMVNGKALGAPGDPKQPYPASFNPQDFRKTNKRDAVVLEVLRGVSTEVIRIEPPQ